MSDTLQISFYGNQADRNELDLYDAGRCIEGLGRTVSILSHFFETGQIISQAPSSRSRVSIRPPRAGSFLIEIVIGVTASIIAVPVTVYLTTVMNQWVPGGAAADRARAARLERQLQERDLQLAFLSDALVHREERLDEAAGQAVRRYIEQHQAEHDVLRSITSRSFSNIFRPLGRSADFAVLYGDAPGAYTATVDAATAAQIEFDQRDDHSSEVVAIVSGFSRNSKVGTAFSMELGRGFRFRYGHLGKLSEEDDFSWSQFRQKPLIFRGTFYRFPDGSIKRMEVEGIERIDV